MCKGWFIFFVIAVLLDFKSLAFELDAKLSPETITPGQRFILEVRIKGAETRPELYDELLTQQKGLIVLDRSEFEEPGVIGIRYAMTHYQVGEVNVPPLLIRVGPDSKSTERVSVTVMGTRAEGDNDLREEFGSIGVPFAWDRVLRLAVIAFLSFGVFYFLREWFGRVHWRRIRTRIKFSYPHKWLNKKRPVRRWAAEQLRVFKIRFDSDEDIRSILDDWAQLCRFWIAYEHDIPAQCWTLLELKAQVTGHSGKSLGGKALEIESIRFREVIGVDRDELISIVSQTERTLYAAVA